MKKKTLVIVDMQKDFCNPTGALYVHRGHDVEVAIGNKILKDTSINEVIFTADWHTFEHCSFKFNNGEWPRHCVQYSEGAGISQFILDCCNRKYIAYQIFLKGNDDNTEEYGAFEKIGLIQENGSERVVANNHLNNSMVKFSNKNIILAGIAGDYCVLETLKNLNKSGKFNEITVFMDGIACVNNVAPLNEYLREYPNIKTE
jgi:nicotinamidase-related amidase